MPSKARPEELEKAINKYLQGEERAVQLAAKLGIDRNNFYRWVKRYLAEGMEGLREKKGMRYIEKNPTYPIALKEAAVRAYTEGIGSQKEICKRFGICSTHALQNWLKVYNCHGSFKAQTGGSRMTNARKTRETAIKYNVSYQQVFTWVKKYSELGEAGLEDRRGKRTAQQEPRTEAEKYKIRIAQLEHENYMLKMERDLLKKVEELERRERYLK